MEENKELYNKTIEELYKELDSNIDGLSEEAVKKDENSMEKIH